MCFQTATSASCRSGRFALSEAGRFMVTTRTGPCSSMRRTGSNGLVTVGSALLGGQDGDGGDRGGPADVVGEAVPATVDLVRSRAPQRLGDLDALRGTGGAGRVALRLEAAARIDRQAP